MKIQTSIHRLRKLLDERKRDALVFGRYPAPHTAEIYERRDKSAACKCIAYQGAIRDVRAIECAIAVMTVFLHDNQHKG